MHIFLGSIFEVIFLLIPRGSATYMIVADDIVLLESQEIINEKLELWR
jgi:hypothetical protein